MFGITTTTPHPLPPLHSIPIHASYPPIHIQYVLLLSLLLESPRAHLHVVRMLWLQRHRPTVLTLSFLFCSCVCFCLYGPLKLYFIKKKYIKKKHTKVYHKFSRQLSAFSLCSSGFISAVLALLTIYLSMKVSFSPDIIPSG